jgi:fructokinase
MRIGIDLGGTKTEAILMDAAGAVAKRLRIPTPTDYESLLTALRELVQRLESETAAKGRVIGVAMPGSISPATGKLRNSNTVWLNGTPFHEDLGRLFARPVRLANDANCFALSEAVDGAGAGAPVVFGAILGTGCGGGVVVHGRALEGASRIAGEWGHTPLPWARAEELPAPPCWCGRAGCLETWVSGSGLARWGSLRLGRTLSAEEIIALARQGAKEALDCLDLYCDRLARGLAVIADILDPDVIVLGGGLSNVEEVYPGVREKLPSYVFSDFVGVRILRNSHGDSSGVRGAAWLWRADEIGE